MTLNQNPSLNQLGGEKRRAKTLKGIRIIKSLEPKVIESVKKACFVKGLSTSNIVNEALRDLCALKGPESTSLSRRSDIHPFELGGKAEAVMEFLSRRNDTAFTVFGSHSKKRPNCLVFARYFDTHILDMIEVMIVNFVGIGTIKGDSCSIGSKPCFLFNGELFEQKPEYQLLKGMILDFYHGEEVEELDLEGLDFVISLTATKDLVHFRVYKINVKPDDGNDDNDNTNNSNNQNIIQSKKENKMKREANNNVKIELSPIGPFMDLKCDRVKYASDEMMKKALKIPKQLTIKKTKNIKINPIRDVVGRVHVSDQKLESIQTRKMKGLKKEEKTRTAKN